MHLFPDSSFYANPLMSFSYVLRVFAVDSSDQPLTSNATVINVTVSDENDNDPEISNIFSGDTRVDVREVC
jgi:hypothetical protein